MADNLENIMSKLRKQYGTGPGSLRNNVSLPEVPPPGIPSSTVQAIKPTAVSPTGTLPLNKAQMVPDIFPPKTQQQQQPAWQPNLQAVLQQLQGNTGSGIGSPKVTAPPELNVDANYVNQLMEQWGVSPRSPEEIAAQAKAVVDRQALSRTQIIQRELDRFERDFPHEFERASNMIREEASKMNAQHQEEFASRGMFYSSVMASAVGEVDSKATEMIGEIARDAANRVADLHADLRDVAEWAVLEEEVLRHQLGQEDQALRQQLMNVSLEVAMRAEQNALDRWYQQQQIELQAYGLRLQQAQLKAQQIEATGQYLGYAFMINEPAVKEHLTAMGLTEDAFSKLSLEQQAGLVQAFIGVSGSLEEARGQKLMNDAAAWELSIKQQYGGTDISGETGMAEAANLLDQLNQLAFKKKPSKEETSQIQLLLSRAQAFINAIQDSSTRRLYTDQLNQIKRQLSGNGSTAATPALSSIQAPSASGQYQVGYYNPTNPEASYEFLRNMGLKK